MKTLHTFLLTLFIVAPAFGQGRPPGTSGNYVPASQAEVNAGIDQVKGVTPYTLANWPGGGGGGGPTNGQTAAQVSAIIESTNAAAAKGATLWVDPNGSASGVRGRQDKPFAYPYQAVTASQSGDTIRVNAGAYYIGPNLIQLKTNTSMFCDPNSVFYADSSHGISQAILRPADNSVIWNPTVIVTNANNTFALPIGLGDSDSWAFTNVVIYNARVVNDSDGYYIHKALTPTSWTLYNPVAITAWDTYVEDGTLAVQATNVTHIFNPVFLATNISTLTSQPVQGNSCIKQGNRSFGTIFVHGGYLKCADYSTNGSRTISYGLAVNGAYGIILNGTVLDSSSQTNPVSADVNFGDPAQKCLFAGVGRANGGTFVVTGGGSLDFQALNSVTSLLFTGNGSGMTNMVHGSTVSAGSNISVTRTQNSDGSSNNAVALTDPISLNQENVGTQWATNFLTPTNAFSGVTVDFSRSFWTTNLGGNLTFTGLANLTSSARNGTIITMLPGGADRTIAVPASWHAARGNTLVVSNAFNHSDFLFTCQPGVSTNVSQLDYP